MSGTRRFLGGLRNRIAGVDDANRPIEYPQTVSLNPLKHLSDDELIGAQLGTFDGHENCADCRWLAEHR